MTEKKIREYKFVQKIICLEINTNSYYYGYYININIDAYLRIENINDKIVVDNSMSNYTANV